MFREISTKDIKDNACQLIGNEWMLVTARKPDGSVNAMTASWGGLGVMWHKDVAFVVIRPQRYTKEFMDSSEEFSLTFFDDSYKKMLGYMGKVSGRDEDKMTKSGLTVTGDVPYYEECRMALICKKLFVQRWDEDSFIDKSIVEKCYPNKDFHYFFVAEIEKVLIK